MGFKHASISLVLGLMSLDGAIAVTPSNSGPLNTCERQEQCAELQVFKSAAPQLCNDLTCEFEVCLRIYDKPGGNCPSTISHTCRKPEIMCRNDTDTQLNESGFPKTLNNGYSFAEEMQNLSVEFIECQVVGPKQLVEFLVKDGNSQGGIGCAASGPGVTLTPLSSIGHDAECAPRPATTESCTGNGIGVECVWTYYTPDCDGSAYWPGRAQTQAPSSPRTAPPTLRPTIPPSTIPTAPSPPVGEIAGGEIEVIQPSTSPPTAPPTLRPSLPPTTPPIAPSPPVGEIEGGEIAIIQPPTSTPTAPPTLPPTTPPTTPPTAPPTTPPAEVSPPVGEIEGGVNGDPHFKTWNGEMYDFHGVCDLVLLKNPAFQKGLGIEIHVRTKKTKQWSYVSLAVIRIGDDTLEVAGRKAGNTYWINGLQGKEAGGSFKLSGYQVTFRRVNSQQKEYIVHLEKEERITFKTWKDFVRIDVKAAKPESFIGSVGLMGSFPAGKRLGRDNKSIISDLNQFGQEWQVRADEPMLFHVSDGVQAPKKCEIPSKAAVRRRLAESSISLAEAKSACSRVRDEERDMCIYDVMATNEKDVAGAY